MMIRKLLFGILMGLFACHVIIAADNDILIADFEGRNYGEWEVSGEAFGTGPVRGTLPYQSRVKGFEGKGLVNTFLNGDQTQGTLTSPIFKIERPYVNFLIGGGKHPGQTCINLLVEGKIVRSATGKDSERLDWYTWDLRELQRKTAKIQIVDEYSGGWGHILIDYIEQSKENKMRAALQERDRITRIFKTTDLGKFSKAVKAIRKKIAEDPYRPVYHFLAPQNWMNDINGPIYYNGYYHIFYQYEPYLDYWTVAMHWGHARSKDLVYWEDMPIALWPSNKLGEEGCFSGGSVLDKAGKPMIFYTGVNHPVQQQWAAVPVDDDLIEWKKLPDNPVLTTAANGNLDFHDWRDPCLFIHNGVYYMVIGGNINKRGSITIYRALNESLTKWEYLGILYQHPDPKTFNIECPNFFKLGDKWVLVMDDKGRARSYVGIFDTENFTFTPESEDWIDHSWQYYATNFLRDAQDRIVMWAWVRGFAENQGWGSCLSLPRVLSLRPDNTLRVDPLPELKKLRREHHTASKIKLNNSSHTLRAIEGTTLEVIAEFEPGNTSNLGLKLLSCDGAVVMTIGYDGRQVSVNGTTAPLVLSKGEKLTLHIFVDKSLVEVYVNDGRACITRVIWPYYETGNLKIQVYSNAGSTTVDSLDIWKIKPIW